MSGAVASRIIDAMIGGQEDVKEPVMLRHGKMKSKVEELAAALTSKLTDHHRFMLGMVKRSIGDKELIIKELDKEIDSLLK